LALPAAAPIIAMTCSISPITCEPKLSMRSATRCAEM
jgi:hypothetical protein